LLDAALKRLIRLGDLTVKTADGRMHTYGDGSGRPVVVRLSADAARKIPMFPGLHLGEAYMNGGLAFEQGQLWDLLEIAGRNVEGKRLGSRKGFARTVMNLQRRLEQWNDRDASKRNVAHHYDLSLDLYRRFLDEDLQYSCAYFARPDMTLEEAQFAKKAHIAAKLKLEPGMKVLDIGCGWGGMALYLARTFGVEVHGITLSQEQLATAQARAAAAEPGFSDLVRFSLTDYRDLEGEYDRIVSVGMFEHVGAPNYLAYFDAVRRRLKPDGVALIHSIGRADPPAPTQAWIKKYIFPGGYIPPLSEVLPVVEESGLIVTDVEIWRLHYAETLRHWRARFLAQREEIAAMYDDRFCRMWEYYLALSELSFRYLKHMVFQIQLTRRIDALPLTRDYMLAAGPRQARS
jgi:cyclopropane-fatty-acyl-phospholipid synthase